VLETGFMWVKVKLFTPYLENFTVISIRDCVRKDTETEGLCGLRQGHISEKVIPERSLKPKFRLYFPLQK